MSAAEPMPQLLQRNYSGLMDDTMIRYDTDYVGDAFFNKMLVKNMFFGGGIYLNDGYLVNHPTARKHLMNEDSVLRAMIRTGNIQILTRTKSGDDLAKMPETMAASGNASFQKLITSSEWKEFKSVLKEVAESAYFNQNVRPWPKFDMSEGFVKLIKRTFSHTPKELGLYSISPDEFKYLEENFLKLNPLSGNPRAKFEDAAIEIFKSRRNKQDYFAAMREIMNLAKQAYHYNFGLTLTEEDDFGVTVETTVGSSFDELLQTTEIEQAALDNMPLIQIPEDLPMDNGMLFEHFLSPDTKVSRKKREFLGQIDVLIQSEQKHIIDAQKDLREACENYLDEIRYVFKRKIGIFAADELFGSAIHFAVGQIASGSSLNLDETIATAAPTPALALKLQDSLLNMSREILIGKFQYKDGEVVDQNRLVTIEDIRPQLAALAFNPKAASEFTKDLPRFD